MTWLYVTIAFIIGGILGVLLMAILAGTDADDVKYCPHCGSVINHKDGGTPYD